MTSQVTLFDLSDEACIIITGTLFGVIVMGHFCRFYVEGSPAMAPAFVLFTVLAASLRLWPGRLL